MNQEYEEYLQSDAWKNRRQHRLAISGRACAVCRSKSNVHVHHLTYQRIFNEDHADLLPLCEYHHEEAERLIKHGRLSRTGNPLHLAAETIRLLCNPAQCKPKKEKKVRHVKHANNRCQNELLNDPWFLNALNMNRHVFKQEVRNRFDGHRFRGKMLANAFTIYDRHRRARKQQRKELVSVIFNHDADEPLPQSFLGGGRV